MAFDAFLKLDGIDGESRAEGFHKWIQIESFSFGCSNAISTSPGSGGGGGAGKASFQDLSLVSRQSSASIPLFVRTASGEPVKTAQLHLANVAEKHRTFYTIKLTDVLISSFSEAGSGGDTTPVDQFSLSYSKIEMTYVPQSSDGASSSPIVGGWDLKANKKV